ncbi:hypothetical protein VTH82DRAFT_505 [Thermothelomyces myriococcoides]
MNDIIALTSTSLFSNKTTAEDLEQRIPGFSVLHDFFKKWLKLDLTTILTAAALLGAASSGVQTAQNAGSRVYWWIVRFLTASVSIAGNDRLNSEVLQWLGANVLMKRRTRFLTVKSGSPHNKTLSYRRMLHDSDIDDDCHEKRVPVQYLPTFGTTWFFHDRNLFMVRRVMTSSSQYHMAWDWMPDEYAGAPEGNEPLVVMCLGRSVEPIKRFLNTCREFADREREAGVTVRSSKRSYDLWDTTVLRPFRPLETVHFDEEMKQSLVADIETYLDVNTRNFYNKRGIPYRRGYLLYGPPGTGKTSLSLALAGRFKLDLYLLHMPTVDDDNALERLFTALPPRCIVLLEDIDAVSIKRHPRVRDSDRSDDSDESDSDRNRGRTWSRCTLSGLLNVLDGVASQEGRIVLMTSNHADKLDKALIRPGRVDKILYLGHITPRSSELMFLRMFSPDENGAVPASKTAQISPDQLKQLAVDFSNSIPGDVFTPAQVQGYLLDHKNSPTDAAANAKKWAQEEIRRIEEAKENEKKAAEARKKKRRERRRRRAERLADALQDAEFEEEADVVQSRRGARAVRRRRRRTIVQDASESEEADVGRKVGKKGETASENPTIKSIPNGETPNGALQDNEVGPQPKADEKDSAAQPEVDINDTEAQKDRDPKAL